MEEIRGILNIYKPEGFTSHDCVAIIRRSIGIKRVGHMGTLDPMATGVLAVGIGRATRIMDYLDLDKKTYVCTMQLGLETDTYDSSGRVIEEKDCGSLLEADIRAALDSFVGVIDQLPPMYSALKVNGRKLYEYARKGQEVDILTRKITVFDIKVLEISLPKVTFVVECSKGTYIRSLCHDVGAKLGCGACMTALERIQSGVFDVEHAININDVKQMDREQLIELLIPIEDALINFGSIDVDATKGRDFKDGKLIEILDDEIVDIPNVKAGERYKIFASGCFLGVGDLDKGILKSHKVFI